MVSIPPAWNRFGRIGSPTQGGSASRNAAERYHRARELEAVKTAKEEGYFFNITSQFLVDNFCEERYKDFRTVHYIRHCVLPNARIREITDMSFAMRLRICNLSNNYITRIDPLGTCRQLIKLDLHSNQITNIPNHHFWSGMKNLKILHLHDNPISKMDTLQFISNARKLQILTLYDSPLYLRRNYRHHAVNTIITLLLLDRHLVADEEIIEDADFGGKFAAMNPFMEVHTVTQPKGRSFMDEMREVNTVIQRVNSRLAQCSPVLIIQRYFRGHATRKRYHFIMDTKVWAATSIQRWWRQHHGHGEDVSAPPPTRSRDLHRPSSRDQTKSKSRPHTGDKRPVSQPTSIIINLSKLGTGTLQPLADQQSMLDSELPTYRTLEPVKPALPAPMVSDRKLAPLPEDLPRRPITFPYLNPYGSLEVAQELGDLPRVHFRLSGIKTQILLCDSRTQVAVQRLISGQHVRDADTQYHQNQIYQQIPKADKHEIVSDDQRFFSRTQGTMNLSCLLAVRRAYKERDRAENQLSKMEKIMNLREERLAAKRRVEACKEEKRRQVIMERQKDKIRCLEATEQQKLHDLHYLYKSQELRQRANHFRDGVFKELTFINDFTTQQTSISNALLRHDRQSRNDTRQKNLSEFVGKNREEEIDQQEMIKKYLDHRKTMRQAEITLTNASLDAKLLQESSERLQHAHARVNQLRALRSRAKEYCNLPDESVKTIPSDDTSRDKYHGLDKWNTTISVSSGRVGKHHIAVQPAQV